MKKTFIRFFGLNAEKSSYQIMIDGDMKDIYTKELTEALSKGNAFRIVGEQSSILISNGYLKNSLINISVIEN